MNEDCGRPGPVSVFQERFWFEISVSETHTLSGESSAHSCTSQPKLGVFGGAGWRVGLGREAQGRSEQAESGLANPRRRALERLQRS
jgi:hypothetical protein